MLRTCARTSTTSRSSRTSIIELVIVHGWYWLIATMCNALDLGIEDWMRAWPTH
jgi:hypothetical protein